MKVWGNAPSGSEEPVYSTVKRLRAKIDRGAHRHIVSVHGDGYRFEPARVDAAATEDSPREGREASRPTFIGRTRELALLEAALQKSSALVTLVGPGGAGKTRCALDLAGRHSMFFADLSSATDEESMLATLAAALAVPLAGATAEQWRSGLRRALNGPSVAVDHL